MENYEGWKLVCHINIKNLNDVKIITHPFPAVRMLMVQVLEDEAVAHVYPFWNISFLRIPPKISVKSCKAS